MKDYENYMTRRALFHADLIINKPKFDPKEMTPENEEYIGDLWAMRAKNLAEDMKENPDDYEEEE